MNKTVDKCLLTRDKCMPKLHLKQSRITYSACGPFTKHREKIQKFKEVGDLNHIYKNELEKIYFVLNPRYCGYQKRLSSMMYKFFDKK